MLAQMHHLTAAGEGTTSATLSWMLFELAKYPEYQARMRDEVRAARARVAERGDVDFTSEDLDGMKATVAAIKVRWRKPAVEYYVLGILTEGELAGNAPLPPDRVPVMACCGAGRRLAALGPGHRGGRNGLARDPDSCRSSGDRLYLRIQQVRSLPSHRRWYSRHMCPCRLTHVWGEDADQWNPERFIRLDMEKQVKVGVYANL